jgi:RNA polymerase-binding transcription factor DksA
MVSAWPRNACGESKAAIRRCLEGRYGRCLECDEPIAEARLDVDPAAAHCIDCAEGLNAKG